MDRYAIITFEDILAHPHHYISELISNNQDSFLLYQYGPYIAVNYLGIIDNYSRNDFNNKVFLFMVDIAKIYTISNSKSKISDVKSKLKYIFKSCRDLPYEYSETVCDVIIKVLNNIKDYQRSTKSLESAILNYSPIVNYIGKLSDPELSDEIHGFSNHIDVCGYEMDKKIKEILINDSINIIKYNEVFLNIDYINTLTQNERDTHLPSDIVPFLAITENNVRLYFILVYLRYLVNDSARHDMINKIENISAVYNKTHTGDIIDIKGALESFSYIAFSEKDLEYFNK